MKILFVTSNRIGDAVLSTGLLAWLIEQHPGAHLTIACGPAPAPLFAAVPGLERLIAMPKRRRGGHWVELWRTTVGTVWDVVVDLRSSALSYVLPTRRRLVFRPIKDPAHRLIQLGKLVGAAEPPAPRLWTSAEHDAGAAGLLPQDAPVLAVGPTANWGGKQWRAERFAETVQCLTAPGGILAGAHVAVFSAPAERPAAEPVLAAIPPERRLDFAGTADLATIAACLRRCALYLGNDSGLMHMAAAAGIPTLGLFGPSPDAVYRPWGERTAVVRTRESYRELVDDPGFDHTSQRSLMDSLSVDAVVAAAEQLWRRS